MELDETTRKAQPAKPMKRPGRKIQMGPLFSVLNVPAWAGALFLPASLLSEKFNPGFETIEARLFTEAEVPWDEIAFRTVKETLKPTLPTQGRGALGCIASTDIRPMTTRSRTVAPQASERPASGLEPRRCLPVTTALAVAAGELLRFRVPHRPVGLRWHHHTRHRGGCSFCRRQWQHGLPPNTAPPCPLGRRVAAGPHRESRRERAWRAGWWQRVGTHSGGGGTSRPNRSRTQVHTVHGIAQQTGVFVQTGRGRPGCWCGRPAAKSPTMGRALWAPWPSNRCAG